MPGRSEPTALAWESALRAELARQLPVHSGGRDEGVDIRSRDGAWAVELKASVHGARDLQAALTQLAIYVDGHPHVRRATLVARFPRMTAERVLAEWMRAQAVLRPAVAERLALVALAPDGDSVVPRDDPEASRILAIARHTFDATAPKASTRASAPRWSRKTYEVWKVLLDAWLRREPPLPLHEIERRSGASYPSVSDLLGRLEASGELERTSSRSATLTGPPRRSLAEVLALGDGLRETHRFVDRSGRAPDARDLVRRFVAKSGADAALGGVEAARHYMPSFNLNGLPRVDVTVTARDDLGWVRKLDPALAEGPPSSSTGSPALVVHRLRRPIARFDAAQSAGVSFADPAEVLLDLHELRLAEQAEELVRALRERRAK